MENGSLSTRPSIGHQVTRVVSNLLQTSLPSSDLGTQPLVMMLPFLEHRPWTSDSMALGITWVQPLPQ